MQMQIVDADHPIVLLLPKMLVDLVYGNAAKPCQKRDPLKGVSVNLLERFEKNLRAKVAGEFHIGRAPMNQSKYRLIVTFIQRTEQCRVALGCANFLPLLV